MALKKINVATAVTISGTISGKFINAKLVDLPRHEALLIMPSAASVATVVEHIAAITAMVIEFQAAVLNLAASLPKNTSLYTKEIPCTSPYRLLGKPY